MSESTQVSSLPLPPMQYVNWYTDENIERGVAPSPPRPIQESYSMFGVQFQTDDVIIRPLETQGIRRLYPQNYDHKRELKKLNHSILVNFLDLLDILIRCPDTSKREEKRDDIKLLFIHMHHLINEFRPHQARETLRVMLEVQKRQRLETAERFQKHLDKVRELLQNTLSSLPETADLVSKLMVPTEFLDTSDTQGKPDAETEDCHRLDKLMCNIIDTL
ncbi:mediator of RNA polymerase II transcription subunit 7-like [Limulus polyphemus]|uniref:Mediator of RNA polymerase II transcription subunit 7 n=1 Tax=Limulus polyphemus TaxID=6850 RepID=A0ABM1RVJ1_LIMPO|nr:mediator of RNA polymerase II transcription subunit 7-like [Limulus polyphemus]XP_013791753.1 mediator of RNA polymerase II transcription subunit 7-like [Limulus polyphemus]XP_022235395.1 mediator of RNA polymerase II transcription subunit 7-like [Limulus polyphemus]XP_022235396.1 mediator of RNA polymerase II transcription subunit 7-like [Limulus polyphemus]